MQKSRLRYAVLSTAIFAAAAFAAAPQGAKLADEPNVTRFTLPAAATVSFVRDGVVTEKTLPASSYDCVASTFGLTSTPASARGVCSYTLADGGVVVVAPPAVDPLGQVLAKEHIDFTLTAPMRVAFGLPGKYRVSELPAGKHLCRSHLWQDIDPAPGFEKNCYGPTTYPVTGTTTPTPTPVAAVLVAGQGGTFSLTTATAIKFGNPNGFYQKTLLAGGPYTCQSNFMGDPPGAIGQNKSCYTVGSDESWPQSPNRDGTGETTSGGGSTGGGTTTPPVTSSNPIDTPEKYRAAAATIGYEGGITLRYGLASTKPRTTVSYPTDRPVRSYRTLAGNSQTVQADGVIANRGCNKDGWCGDYNIGDRLFGATDDYSSSINNVAFIPVRPVPTGIVNKRYPGFGSFEAINMGHNTMSTRLQPSWTTYIDPARNNADTDENVARYAGIQGGYDRTKFDMQDCPVATTRGYGRGGWTTNAVGITCDGRIFGYGSNTAHNFFTIDAVRNGLVPTGLTISNSGEFLFISAWDTVNIKGKVIVVAMSDACQWCAGIPESQWEQNWGNHRQEYPGLPGLGNYSNAKVIGELDLPDGMTAPTELSVTTGKEKRGQNGYERIQNFWRDNLLTEANRAKYYNGDWTGAIARTGMLTVIDKYNQKAAFFDLRPLFQYYRSQYFTKNQADWNALIASRGPGASQWPYTFDVAAQQKPTLIKEITLTSQPTAVQMTRNAPHRAFIATMDGEFRVFDLGTGYLDQTASTTGNPADIKQLFSINVGGNPTSIAFKKETNEDGGTVLYPAGTKSMEQFFWVSSRQENQATFLEFNNAMTSVSKKFVFEDSNIRDMIAIEDVDNHGTESYILNVADYEGMALHSAMYGPIKMKTANQANTPCPISRPCLLRDNKQFEYVNSVKLPGKPFKMSVSNIN